MSATANASPPETERPRRGTNRRAFLAGVGVGSAAVGGLVATAGFGWPQRATPPSGGHDGSQPSADDTGMTDEEMNEHHRAEIERFLANIEEPITAGVGALDAEWTMDGDTRVFELTCSEIEWEVTPGTVLPAFAYNGMVPGPTLRCREGERVRVHVKNELSQSTSVHWHGQRVPNDQDGVPYITQEPIRPGETFTYEFVASPAGTHMYHSHHNATEQVGKGLLGALIVEPAEAGVDPPYDRDYLLILNDALGGYTLNGKGFPATQAFVADLGERVRFRFLNEGQLIHPMHLHGMPMRVIARDGWPLPQPFMCDTLNIAPGERWDVIVEADLPGVWAFHCHILSHAEGPTGMFGMVTALIVNDPAADTTEQTDTDAGEGAAGGNDEPTSAAAVAPGHGEH